MMETPSTLNRPNSPPVPSEMATGNVGSPPWVDLTRYDQSWYQPGRSKPIILLWWLLQAVIFPLTLHAHHQPRRWLLRLFGAHIGKGVVIRPTARFTYPWKVTIGDYSWIGDDVVFYSLDTIVVGQHCVVSQKSYLCTGSHRVEDPAFGLQTAPIVLENGVWIASDCFVSPGVRIGANTVVGTRSTVLKSLPAGHLCWGSPCQVHKTRQMAAVAPSSNP